MKIWHISDTHTFHGLLNIQESGDATNPKDPYISEIKL